jgi:hypothetical protein
MRMAPPDRDGEKKDEREPGRAIVISARDRSRPTRHGLVFGILALLPLTTLTHGAPPPGLAVPVDCEIGKACILQNYVDHDAGPAARDYRCGFLTYDGHKGTDIRVIDPAALRRGVAVLASAPGRVRAVRDGMSDVSVRVTGKAAVANREAGNTVVIDHGGGWETQYAHLRNGSVAVRAGDPVRSGQRLGLVGLSGQTEFPHLHFEVRHGGRTVDPFVGLDAGEPCRAGTHPLWPKEALAALAYVETGVLDAGISAIPPTLSAGDVDREKAAPPAATAEAVVFWVQIFGAREDDLEEFRLVGPGGAVLAERRSRLERNLAQWLAYTGKRRDGPAWPAGIYRGEYTLYRGAPERKLLSLVREVRIAAE